MKNNLSFLDPLHYLDNSFHRKGLKESEKIQKKLKFSNLKYKSHKIIVQTFIRFRFNSIFFIKNLLEKIYKKEKINEVVLSGWNNYENEYSLNNYYITEIVKNLFKRKKLQFYQKKKILIKN